MHGLLLSGLITLHPSPKLSLLMYSPFQGFKSSLLVFTAKTFHCYRLSRAPQGMISLSIKFIWWMLVSPVTVTIVMASTISLKPTRLNAWMISSNFSVTSTNNFIPILTSHIIKTSHWHNDMALVHKFIFTIIIPSQE